MPILFGVVAQEQKVLANFAACDGNFIEITHEVLAKLNRCESKMTYYHGPYLIHYIHTDEHLCFCITDKTCQRSRAFLFLNQIHRRFVAEGKDNFSKVLAEEMYRYSEDYSTITVRKGELDQLNSIGVESSEKILGEKILHVNNMENLSYASVTDVSKTPERISVYGAMENTKESIHLQVDKSKAYVVVIIGVLIIFVAGTIYIFGPESCLIVFAVLAYCFFTNYKSQTD